MRRVRHLDLLARPPDRLLLGATPGEALHVIFNDLASELGAEIYLNYMADPDDAGMLRLAYWAGLDVATRTAYASLPFSQALCGMMTAERHPISFERLRLSDEPRGEGVCVFGGRAFPEHPLVAQGALPARCPSAPGRAMLSLPLKPR